MRAFRLFALVLFGIGLFVQGAAYASAQPLPAVENPSHCQDMAMGEPAPPGKDSKGCCDDMRLGCLVGMNCIAPLFPPAHAANDLVAPRSERSYSIAALATRRTFVPQPERPPPQSHS